MNRALVAALFLLFPAAARAAGWIDVGEDLERPRADRVTVVLEGYLRTRGEGLYNLDLDRGATPSGEVLFPVPADGGQLLTSGDLRLRLRPALFINPGVGLHAELDVFDNLALGSTPATPARGDVYQLGASPGQEAPLQAVRVNRIWADAVTPAGLLSVGRMPSRWGLGIAVGDGECLDCDTHDSSDRIALVLPLVGLVWGAGYDFGASGAVSSRAGRPIDLDPSDDVRAVHLAVSRFDTPRAVERQLAAGRAVLNAGLLVSQRWQERENLLGDDGRLLSIRRGFSSQAFDLWLRLLRGRLRVEAEAILVLARVANPSELPGVAIHVPITSTQLGAALESDYRLSERTAIGLNVGYASGDGAPGFGASRVRGSSTRPGDFEGPQFALPSDATLDNYRFHPDYRIDQILFRNLVGRVTDAVYVRPHLRHDLGNGLELSVAAVGSMAVMPQTPPGQQQPLGIELDPGLRYQSEDGFHARLEYALLLPLAGLNNPAADLPARPAQLGRVLLGFAF